MYIFIIYIYKMLFYFRYLYSFLYDLWNKKKEDKHRAMKNIEIIENHKI
jgi:hypothetical protein